MKILAVEDDPVALSILEDGLKSLGHSVFTAADGETGWDVLRNEGCRVVVCDWNMPKLSGLGLCERIRECPGEYIYFILLTGREGTDANRERAIAAGVDDFLLKPMDVEELAMRLHVAKRILQYTTRIERLESLIPICSYCKNVRDDQSYWQKIETYLAEKTGADCSHSVCPECYQKHVVPQFEALGMKNYPTELTPRAPVPKTVRDVP